MLHILVILPKLVSWLNMREPFNRFFTVEGQVIRHFLLLKLKICLTPRVIFIKWQHHYIKEERKHHDAQWTNNKLMTMTT